MIFSKQSVNRASPERVLGFHEKPDALKRLTPPWEPTRVVQAVADLRVGSLAQIETRVPVRIREFKDV